MVTGTQQARDTTGLGHNAPETQRVWDTTRQRHNRTGTQRARDTTGLKHNGTGTQKTRDTTGTGTQRALVRAAHQTREWGHFKDRQEVCQSCATEVVHNRTGTQRDWGTTGLGHNRTGTQQDWDEMGRPIHWTISSIYCVLMSAENML